MHIGNKITSVREALGVDQEALAKALKIRKRTMAQIEQTKRISDAALVRIAAALAVPVSVIKDYLNDSRNNNADDKANIQG